MEEKNQHKLIIQIKQKKKKQTPTHECQRGMPFCGYLIRVVLLFIQKAIL